MRCLFKRSVQIFLISGGCLTRRAKYFGHSQRYVVIFSQIHGSCQVVEEKVKKHHSEASNAKSGGAGLDLTEESIIWSQYPS